MYRDGDSRNKWETKKRSDFITTIIGHGSILHLINIKLHTYVNVGSQLIHLLEEELHTTRRWFTLSEAEGLR